MEVGPFNIREVETIRTLLESKKIEFSVLVDKEVEEAIMNDFHAKATEAPLATAGSLDLQTVYFEISEEDFEKVKFEFEKYGILPPSDGSYELGED